MASGPRCGSPPSREGPGAGSEHLMKARGHVGVTSGARAESGCPRLPRRLGGWSVPAAVSICFVGRTACVIDCVGTLDRSLMQARCGTALQMDSLWNRWFRRQRLNAHAPEVAPARSWARFSESLVSWHISSFGRLCCVTSIYSRVARFPEVWRRRPRH
jgi:hypothetical protein